MALKVIEGFDAFSAFAQISTGRKFRTEGTTGTLLAGRYGGAALSMPGSSFFSSNVIIAFDPISQLSSPIISFGMAIRPTGSFGQFCGLASSGDAQLLVGADGSGYITLSGYESSNDTFPVRATSSNVFVEQNKWYYLEVVLDLSAGGDVTVFVNGEQALTFNNLPLFSAADINELVLGSNRDGGTNPGACDYDDIYLVDQTGVDNTARLGDSRIELFRPTSDITLTMSAIGSVTGFGATADVSGPDGDTTYVSGSATGERFLGDSTDALSNNPNAIFGAELCVIGRKDGATDQQLDFVLSSNAVESVVLGRPLLDDYAVDGVIFERNPDGNAIWTRAAIEAAQFGVEVN